MNFIDAQQKAIQAEGNVLVLAGAGTGKTHTMIERCLHCLFHPTAPVNLDQILMVTFTEAAAAEMKQRIAGKLNRQLDPENTDAPTQQRAAEQLALLDMAKIGTLHSIALELIYEHTQPLGLSPRLRTLSQAERSQLERAALAETLEAHCLEPPPASPSIRQWMRQEERHRVREWILQLHNHTQLLPAPQQWIRKQRQRCEAAEPTLWLRWLADTLPQWISDWLPALRDGAESCPNLQECVAALESLQPSLAQPDNPTALAEPLAVCFCRIATADENWPHGTKTRVRKTLKEFFADAAFFESLFWDRDRNQPSLSPLREDWEQCRQWILSLLRLAEDFQQRFLQQKKEQEALDFHDMEQWALTLLCGADRKACTDTAREMQARFQYVFADEYQDITKAQDCIIRALSRRGRAANLFIVGDEKQSIYGFRGATPELLQERQSEQNRQPENAVVHLQENFRSHPDLINFINGFCDSLARQVPGFRYDASARLIAAAPNTAPPHATGRQIEFHLALKTQKGEAASTSEAHRIAQRIRALGNSKTAIFDAQTKKPRPAKWVDFAVLLRSVAASTEIDRPEIDHSEKQLIPASGMANTLSQVFRQYEIPVQMFTDNFFDLPEIRDLVALLKILDNPLQDIPLLAVLRSPFFGFTPDELAVIRLAQTQGHFWPALRRFDKLSREPAPRLQTLRDRHPAESEKWIAAAREKCDRFLTSFQRWSDAGRTQSIAERIERILAESHCLEALSSLEPWRNLQAQARQFLQLTRDFEHRKLPSLAHFLQWLDELQQSEHGIEPLSQETANAVQLMTIHKSKGLEFPIVILANLDKKFNCNDLRQPLIIDSDYGLSPVIRLPGTAQTYPSLSHWLSKRKRRQALIAEEARLLYIAMTRAKERLILTGTTTKKHFETWPKQHAQVPENNPSHRAASCLDWLGPWLSGRTCIANYLEIKQGSENGIHWEIRDAGVDEEPQPPAAPAPPSQPLDLETLHTLHRRLNWRYPFLAATAQRAKASASALKQQSQLDTDHPFPLPAQFKTKKPKAENRPQESAQTRGHAWHRILQFFPLDQATNLENARAAVQSLCAQGRLEPEDPSRIQLNRIVEFWTSSIGTQIRRQSPRLHRELAFTAQFTGRELRQLGFDIADAIDNEPMLIQGAADLAVIQPKEIWLLDFKSDKITVAEIPERAEHHAPQLALYRAALQKIYRRPVASAWIHFLHPGITADPLNP